MACISVPETRNRRGSPTASQKYSLDDICITYSCETHIFVFVRADVAAMLDFIVNCRTIYEMVMGLKRLSMSERVEVSCFTFYRLLSFNCCYLDSRKRCKHIALCGRICEDLGNTTTPARYINCNVSRDKAV